MPTPVTMKSGGFNANSQSESFQRLIDTDSQGTIWKLYYDTNQDIAFLYSTDNGASWTDYGAILTAAIVDNYTSIFIDADNVIHVVYKETSMKYVRFTISYPGPTLSASSVYTHASSTGIQYPNLVVHQHGTDKKIHINAHNNTGGNARYIRLNLTSGGTVTSDTDESSGLTTGRGGIDFYHTGDRQTVQSSTPHVFLCGQNGNTLTFVKVTYSGGTWTVGTVRDIYTTMTSGHYASLCFDGTRVVMSSTNTTSGAIRVHQRDAADTTTTDLSPAGVTMATSCKTAITYDSDNGDIYVTMADNTDLDPYYIVYTRNPGTWGAKTIIEASINLVSPFSVDLIGHSRIQRVGASYIEDLATDRIRYVELAVLNEAPTTTITLPLDGQVVDTSQSLLLKWDYSDPDADPQAYYRIKRIVDAVTTGYWNGTSWDSSEAASNKIAGTATQVDFGKNWGDPSTETTHAYSVKTWDNQGQEGAYSTTVTIYPFSNKSTNRGLSFPVPYKKQENVLASLKSNTDYTLSWVNNYLPSYGDLNEDLYIRAGLRPGDTSTMRSMFPPSVGVFSVGNGTNYFQDIGGINIYRTNELALSSEKFKDFHNLRISDALAAVLSVPIEAYSYIDEKRNYGAPYRFGIVLEDVKDTLGKLGINSEQSAFIITDANGNEFLNSEQLIYVLWQAVQELAGLVLPSVAGEKSRFRRPDEDRKSKKNKT